MKRIIIFALTIMLIVSMAIPAYAVTPKFKIPNIPKVPEIKVELQLSESFWDNWFTEHPIKIDFSNIKFGK